MRYIIGGGTAMQIDVETYWYGSNCNLHTPIIFAKSFIGANGFQNYTEIYILKEYALGLNSELNENASSFSFKIVDDEILLDNMSNFSQTINLMDLTGRIIVVQDIKPFQKSISISIELLSNSIYLLKSSNGNSFKISIVH